jgi:uncharacterized protein (TIGR02217 family)
MFKTTILELSSGREKRNIDWSKVRASYDALHGIKTHEDMDAIRAFFYARQGRAYGFRFKDWGDFEISQQSIGTTDTSTTDFQIFKRYTSGSVNYDRDITKPVEGTVEVWVNSVSIEEGVGGSNFQVDTTTGIITLGSTLAATTGQTVEVDCQFDVPVRFDTDHFAPSHDFYNIESWESIPLLEVRDIT